MTGVQMIHNSPVGYIVESTFWCVLDGSFTGHRYPMTLCCTGADMTVRSDHPSG